VIQSTRARFEVDSDPAACALPPAPWTGSDGGDAGQPENAAISPPEYAQPRFLVDGQELTTGVAENLDAARVTSAQTTETQSEAQQAALLRPPDPDAWRREVAARVTKYRSRRRAPGPRYPSLRLRFEPTEPSGHNERGTAADTETFPADVSIPHSEPIAGVSSPAEFGGRIIEFPRSMANSVCDELADPVFDRPRIIEVPDLPLEPPALGGILIEPAADPAPDRRPGFDFPLQSAPMSRRFLAAGIDASIVLSAFVAFAYASFRITSTLPPLNAAGRISAVLVGVFWIAYRYLLLVHVGTTPGLKLAKLRLSHFDGTAVPKATRRWRVLTSVLSGLSLGLGYAWCFLDEDRLCWHDRITHTYIAPGVARAV